MIDDCATRRLYTTSTCVSATWLCLHGACRNIMTAHTYLHQHSLSLVRQSLVSTMDPTSQRHERRDGALSSLNVATEAMNLAKEVSAITPAKAVFGSVSILLTMMRVCFP